MDDWRKFGQETKILIVSSTEMTYIEDNDFYTAYRR
jgi:hypothetical protein